MMAKQFIRTWLAASAVLIVGACGGGEGGGIGGTGSPVAVSYGGVTALGSVWVNGVEFDTGSASVRIDDRSGTAAELLVGMVVQVDGSISAARADTVTVESALKGFVERVDDANHLVVMGQTVQVDDRTLYEGDVVPIAGDRVEVHGLVVADGVVFGSRVDKRTSAPTPAFAVKGYVKSLDTLAKTFTLGTLSVNYSGATLADLGSGPTNGQFVEVKGLSTACAGTPVCGVLTASRVQASGLRVSGSAQAEVEGFVAPGSVASSNFRIGAQAVTTTPATVFIGGTLADVLAGARLEVEGSLTNGVLAASRVRFLDSIRIEASVAIRVGNTLTFTGLPGVTASANALTEFSGIASLADVAPGDLVRLRGRPAAGHAVVLMRIEPRTGGNGRTILQATVDSVAPPQLNLLGVPVDTGSILVDASFKGVGGSSIGRTAFFAAVKAGSLVKARGTPSGAGLALDEIEFED